MKAQQFFEIFDSKWHFGSDLLESLWWGDLLEDEEVKDITEVEYGDMERWNHLETRIVKIRDRYFELARWAANTEYQQTEYDCQPIEVQPVEKIIVCWEPVDQKTNNCKEIENA